MTRQSAPAAAANSRDRRAAADPAGDERRSDQALDFDRYIPAHITYLANKISNGASATYRPKFGIGITDWRIMAALAVTPWVTAGRIGDAVGLDKAAVSRSVHQMAGRGLVEMRQDGADQRRQLIALTRRGLLLHDRIVAVSRERERRLLADFSQQDRAILLDLLMRMRARLAAMNGTGPEAC